MKNLLLVLVLIYFACPLFAQTATPPSAGDGSSGNPYQIATLNNLYWITQDSTRWDKVYTQTADIDATTSSSWDGGAGFSPIGNGTIQFTGSYDGQGYKITGLFISRSKDDNIGFFGIVTDATIKNLKLDSVRITGKYYVGGLIGFQQSSSTVTNCGSEGSVTGAGYVGGLIGARQVSATSNCYSSGSVTCAFVAGGLIGDDDGSSTSNCYSTDSVTGCDYVGGLIGYQCNSSTDTNCYSTGSVTGSSDVGGLIAYQSESSATNCFWDTTSSGQTSSVGGTGKSTAEMKNYLTFTGWSFKGISGGTIWNIGHGRNNGYPYLNWQYPGDSPITGVSTTSQELVPRELTLKQNYPNPFNPTTTIEFTVPEDGRVSLKIFDMLGREVATAFEGDVKAGYLQKAVFDASRLSSGVYFSRLQYKDKSLLKKLVFMK
jgi:hypothetical protein